MRFDGGRIPQACFLSDVHLSLCRCPGYRGSSSCRMGSERDGPWRRIRERHGRRPLCQLVQHPRSQSPAAVPAREPGRAGGHRRQGPQKRQVALPHAGSPCTDSSLLSSANAVHHLNHSSFELENKHSSLQRKAMIQQQLQFASHLAYQFASTVPAVTQARRCGVWGRRCPPMA